MLEIIRDVSRSAIPEKAASIIATHIRRISRVQGRVLAGLPGGRSAAGIYAALSGKKLELFAGTATPLAQKNNFT